MPRLRWPYRRSHATGMIAESIAGVQSEPRPSLEMVGISWKEVRFLNVRKSETMSLPHVYVLPHNLPFTAPLNFIPNFTRFPSVVVGVGQIGTPICQALLRESLARVTIVSRELSAENEATLKEFESKGAALAYVARPSRIKEM